MCACSHVRNVAKSSLKWNRQSSFPAAEKIILGRHEQEEVEIQLMRWFNENIYVSLRSQHGAGRTDGRRNSPQPGPRTRHDSAKTSGTRQVAGTQSDVCRVSEVFRRDAEVGERDSEAAGGLERRVRASV